MNKSGQTVDWANEDLMGGVTNIWYTSTINIQEVYNH